MLQSRVLNKALTLLFAFFVGCQFVNALTITDANGIIYDIVNGTHNVNISSSNAGLSFLQQTDVEGLVIPEKVTDVSASASSTDNEYTVVGMLPGAFKNCTGLKSIEIQAPIPLIPSQAFDGCTSLATVVLPNSVTQMDYRAFYGCTNLASITGFASLQTLGSYVFHDCSSLKQIVLPENLSSIGDHCFYRCTSLEEVVFPDKITTIPTYICSYCSSLKRVVLPSAVVKIGNEAFRYCNSLEMPVLPSTLKTMEHRVFADCGSLGKVTLIPGLQLYDECFMGSYVTEIEFPTEELSSLGSRTFHKTSGLKTVTLPKWLHKPEYSWQGWYSTLFDSSSDLEEVNLEEGLKEIGSNWFSNCPNLTTVNCASTLREIWGSCFQNCAKLMNINLPEEMDEIGYSAFNGCKSLTTINIPKGVSISDNAFKDTGLETINFPDAPLGTISSTAFYHLPNVKSLTIPGRIGTLPSNLFSYFDGLESVIFEEGVTEVPDRMFYYCKNLKSVQFPSTLTTIGESAFEAASYNYTSSLTSITFPEGLKEIKAAAFSNSALEEIIFPSTLERIGYDQHTGVGVQTVFGGSQNLRKITFKGCKTIGYCAFISCPSLTEINFPPNLEVIADMAFSECGTLTEVTIPEGVKVGDKAFSSKGIATVTLSKGTELGNYVFYKCDALTTINFPDEPCSFGTHVFNTCGKLTSVTLPDWMETVPEGMFYKCGQLENLTFGENVKTIGKNAFYECFLSNLTLPSTIEEIGPNAFEKIKASAITLPAGCKIGNNAFSNSYINTINFPETDDPEKYEEVAISFGNDVFSNTSVASIEFPAWMTVIPNGFLSSVTPLTHIGFKGAITEIDDYAFRNCYKLTNVDFPPSLSRIGKYAFYYCGTYYSDMVFGPVVITGDVSIDDHAFDYARITELTFGDCADLGEGCLANQKKISSITFPECMTTIPAEFCNGWSELTSVTLSDKTRRIGDKAFYNCEKLTDIILPETVDSIGAEAFNYTGIKEITLPDHHVELAEKALVSSDIYLGGGNVKHSPLERVVMSRKQKSIPANCFNGNHTMKTFEWYGDVEETAEDGTAPSLVIGDKAFYECNALDKIEFPDKNLWVGTDSYAKCSGAKSIEWPDNDKEVELSTSSFAECSSLETLTIPDALTEVPTSAFSSCSSLTEVTLGKNLTKIGQSSFEKTGIETIHWNDKISSIDKYAFGNAKIRELEFPETVVALAQNAFADNTRQIEVEEDGQLVTKTVGTIEKFHLNSVLTAIPEYCFQYSISAEEIFIPSNIRVIGNMAFMNCDERKLTFETAEDGSGVEYIYQSVFQNNRNLEYLELPSTLKSQESYGHIGVTAFDGCTSLKKIVNKVSGFKARNSSFNGCTSLEEFSSEVPVVGFGISCFAGCSSLTTIDIPQIYYYDWFHNSYYGTYYGDNCFENCTALSDYSFFKSYTGGDKYIFKDCKGFKEFVMPDSITATPLGILNGASNLQSITWTFKGDRFEFHPEDISGAPLEGLSFSRSAEVRMPISTDKTPYDLPIYKPNAQFPTTSPERSILMVPRGERWKYVTMGYDQVFDIREMRQPQIDLQGDIRSSFNSIVDEDGKITITNDNKNHYHANLRWHMPLSDFNTNGETVVRIYRDDICIGRVRFSQPVVLERTDLGDAWKYPEIDKIWRVTMSYDNPDGYTEYTEHRKFTGDFTTSTEVENEYKMEYVYQEDYMDFDYNTHQRLLDYVNNGYKSWFAFCDIFTSLPLNDSNVAATYTYHAEMEGFSYDTLENNPDFELVDGKRYSVVTMNEDELPFKSNDVMLYSSIATPKVNFDGLVSFSDIQQDKEQGMKFIDMTKNNIDNLKVGYSIDEKTIKHRYEYAEKHENDFVIKKFILYQLMPDGNLEQVGDVEPTSRLSEGDFNVAWGYKFLPGNTYVLVTQTNSRGDFGSAAITIPGVPTISPEASKPEPTEHLTSSWHDKVGYKVSITSGLDCSDMGYDKDNPLTKQDYYIGLIRRHTSPMLRAQGSDEWNVDDDDTELVHHYDGRQSAVDADVCADCSSEIQTNVEHDAESGPTYFDHVEVPLGQGANLDYKMRLYVKVPDYMLRTSEPMYMLAEATAPTSAPVVSGVENVTTEPTTVDGDYLNSLDEADVRYFDLHGRQIARPAVGTPCIVVTPAGPFKFVMR